MGSIGVQQVASKPVVGRMDLSGLTPAQRDVMEGAYSNVEFARTHTLQEWALSRVTGGFYTVEQMKQGYRPVTEWQDYRYKSQEDSIRRQLDYAEDYADKYGENYEAAKRGQVLTTTSTNTLRALQKRGFIEILDDGGRTPDTVRIIERW